MKPLFTRTLPAFIVFMFLMSGYSFANTYNTIAHGNWNSSSTWAGGLVPDPENIQGHIIFIDHNVTLQNNNVKLLTNAQLIINNSEFIVANGNFTIEFGSVIINNSNIIIGGGHNLELTTCNARLEINNSVVEISQNFKNTEGFRILNNLCLNVHENYQNNDGIDSLINVNAVIGSNSSGNLQNSKGLFYADNSGFHLPNGNLQNQSGSLVDGNINAFWLQNGNLENSGVWWASVNNYCVSGNVTVPSSSLPPAQNCNTISTFFSSSLCCPGDVVDEIIVVNHITCSGGGNDGSIVVTLNTGSINSYSFLWSTGDTITSLQNLTSGVYLLTITDAVGCSENFQIEVLPNDSLSLSGIVTDVSCFAGNDGSIDLSVMGTPPYIYLWSNGSTTEDISNLTAGTYSVTVTDQQCQAQISFTVDEPDMLQTVFDAVHVSCSGLCDGSVLASASGGTAPFQYVWSTGDTTALITGLCPGVYYVSITDANQCMVSDSIEIVDLSTINCPISGPDDICPGSNMTYAAPNVAGTYSWQITGGASIVGSTSNPQVEIAAAMGCNTSFTLTLTINAGNCSYTCVKFVTVTDTILPLCNCPPVTTVACGDPIVFTQPVITDNCDSNLNIFIYDTHSLPQPDGSIYHVRIWQATDFCGNTTLASQGIIELCGPQRIISAANPNPFRKHTTIHFIPTESTEKITVEVYSMTGTLVSTLFSGPAKAGIKHDVPFFSGTLPDGIYIYRIYDESVYTYGKMVLTK